jgi:hypothetical protein
VVLCYALSNHDSPVLPVVLAQFNRSGVARHRLVAMGYRILNQNSNPTPRAIIPVKRPEPGSPFPGRGEASGLDWFGAEDGFCIVDGVGSGTQFPVLSVCPKHCAVAV